MCAGPTQQPTPGSVAAAGVASPLLAFAGVFDGAVTAHVRELERVLMHLRQVLRTLEDTVDVLVRAVAHNPGLECCVMREMSLSASRGSHSLHDGTSVDT